MHRRQVLRVDSDGVKVHADLAALATFHCNDMVVDRQGRAYVGNFGFDLDHALHTRGVEGVLAEHPTAVLARVDPDGSVHTASTAMHFPNGSVITPDGKTLIVAETLALRLTAFDIAADGTLSNRRVWAPVGMRAPDGICLDREWPCLDRQRDRPRMRAVRPGRRDRRHRRDRSTLLRLRARRRRRQYAVHAHRTIFRRRHRTRVPARPCAVRASRNAGRGECMTETGLPTYLTRQFALTKPQLATELGAELLSLCQTVTADGRLAPEEIAGLRQWLRDAEAAELQAARFLRGVIERVLADGRITAEEYQEVYRAVETVLPFEARQQAHSAREQAESSDLAARVQAAAAQTPVARAAQAESAAHRRRHLHGRRRATGWATRTDRAARVCGTGGDPRTRCGRHAQGRGDRGEAA